MRKQLLAVSLSGVTALASAALAFAAPGAQSAPAEPDRPPTGVEIHEAATTKAEHNRIVDYWTPARMRNAISADELVAERDKSSATGRVAVGAPQVVGAQGKPPKGTSLVGAYYTGGGQVVQTTGKVFFTLGGSNYVCSGSSTTSANHDLVSTAGHCV